jgi:hypothetical protein
MDPADGMVQWYSHSVESSRQDAMFREFQHHTTGFSKDSGYYRSAIISIRAQKLASLLVAILAPIFAEGVNYDYSEGCQRGSRVIDSRTVPLRRRQEPEASTSGLGWLVTGAKSTSRNVSSNVRPCLTNPLSQTYCVPYRLIR